MIQQVYVFGYMAHVGAMWGTLEWCDGTYVNVIMWYIGLQNFNLNKDWGDYAYDCAKIQ